MALRYNELLKFFLRNNRFPRLGDHEDFADYIKVVEDNHARNGVLPAMIVETYDSVGP